MPTATSISRLSGLDAVSEPVVPIGRITGNTHRRLCRAASITSPLSAITVRSIRLADSPRKTMPPSPMQTFTIPSPNRWSPLAPLPHPLGSVSVAVARRRDSSRRRSRRAQCWHASRLRSGDKRYSESAPLPVGRDHMGLAAYDGRLYAIGGRIDTPAHNTSYVTSMIRRPTLEIRRRRCRRRAAAWRLRLIEAPFLRSVARQRGDGERLHDQRARTIRPPTFGREYAPLPEGRHGTGAAVIERTPLSCPAARRFQAAAARATLRLLYIVRSNG